MENFVYKLALLSIKYKMLHVSVEEDFILTYDKICREEQSNTMLFAGGLCTPTRKTISDSPIVLRSSSNHPLDSRDYKGRYKNFNIYYLEVGTCCIR
jgi:hypothetical protein